MFFALKKTRAKYRRVITWEASKAGGGLADKLFFDHEMVAMLSAFAVNVHIVSRRIYLFKIPPHSEKPK